MEKFKQFRINRRDRQEGVSSLPSEDFVSSPNSIKTAKTMFFGDETSIGPGYSGPFTPNVLATGNLSSVVAYQGQFLRVGKVCTLSGMVFVDPVATSTPTTLQVSLPFPSTQSSLIYGGGTAFSNTIAGLGAALITDPGDPIMEFQWVPSDASATFMFYTFTYTIA